MSTMQRVTVTSIPLAGAILLLAGCGGSRNPLRLDVRSQHVFFDGLWDGLTVPFVFIIDLARPREYPLIIQGAPDYYYVGYAIGVVLLLAAVAQVWWSFFR